MIEPRTLREWAQQIEVESYCPLTVLIQATDGLTDDERAQELAAYLEWEEEDERSFWDEWEHDWNDEEEQS